MEKMVVGVEAKDDPLLGAVFEGHYEVIRLIGQGGMGNVYLAEETRLKRRCALKVLNAELSTDRTHVERFLREARIMAQLSHPHIVGIHALGEDPAGVFFVMELLVGEGLDARLRARNERPFTFEDSCVWAIQIALAVNVVHKAGLIHRDLKTSNVFLAEQDGVEVVKLLDFGIARPIGNSELTATGVTLGTPSYMSPEQILNKAVDLRSDVYSFGVLLFKLFTGHLPFTGEPTQVTMQHCLSAPPRPSQVAPEAGITPELEQIILKAMAKEPGDRFHSMHEVEDAMITVLRNAGSDHPFTVQSRRPAAQRGLTARPATAPPVVPDTAGTPIPMNARTPNGLRIPTGPSATITAPQTRSTIPRSVYIITTVSALGILSVLVLVITTKLGVPQSPRSEPVAVVVPSEPTPAPIPAPQPAEPAEGPPVNVTPPVVEPVPEPANEPGPATPRAGLVTPKSGQVTPKLGHTQKSGSTSKPGPVIQKSDPTSKQDPVIPKSGSTPKADPRGLSLNPGMYTKQVGNTEGGVAHNTGCAVGSALIGFVGSYDGYHRQIAGVCGRFSLTSAAGGWAVTFTDPAALPTQGPPGATPWERSCPKDQVIVGFSGRAGALVDSLTFTCAPLVVSKAADGTWSLTTGTKTDLAPVGGTGGSPFPRITCPAEQIATRPRLRTGDGLDAFGLFCIELTPLN